MKQIESMSRALSTLTCGVLLFSAAELTGQARQTVQFLCTAKSIAIDHAVYVLGNLPELGKDELKRAVKLARTSTGWQVSVSLPADTSYSFRFYDRSRRPELAGDQSNGTPIGDLQTGVTAKAAAPKPKRLVHLNRFAAPQLFWRQDDREFTSAAMKRSANGRTGKEGRWSVKAFAAAGAPVEFYVQGEKPEQRDPVEGTYVTPLDALFLQDGELFAYPPAARVKPLRRDYDPQRPPVLDSRILAEKRPYRVILPRGYDEHSTRRYPVIYAHDGWLWFDEGQASVDLDGKVLAELTRAGQIGELIFVGISHPSREVPAKFFPHRARDYYPPGDWCNLGALGMIEGAADRYLEFIKTELKPLIDSEYRTLPDREHTWTTGFSAGGVAAMYVAWEAPEVFSRTGVFAGALETPTLLKRIESEPSRPLRIYIDAATHNDYLLPAYEFYDRLVNRSDPWIVEGNLRLAIGYGQSHTTRDVAKRFPGFLKFLYPANETPQAAAVSTARIAPRAAARRLANAFKSADDPAIIELVREHCHLDNAVVIRALARGLKHESLHVRWAVLIALRYSEHKSARSALIAAKQSKLLLTEEETAAEYYLALGQHADKQAVSILVKGLAKRGQAPRVSRAQVHALGRIQVTRSVKELQKWLRATKAKSDSAEVVAACLSLGVLTGHDAGTDPRVWIEWWQTAKSGYALPRVESNPVATDATWQQLWAVPTAAVLFKRVEQSAAREKKK